jgi:hypothetical protein
MTLELEGSTWNQAGFGLSVSGGGLLRELISQRAPKKVFNSPLSLLSAFQVYLMSEAPQA